MITLQHFTGHRVTTIRQDNVEVGQITLTPQNTIRITFYPTKDPKVAGYCSLDDLVDAVTKYRDAARAGVVLAILNDIEARDQKAKLDSKT